MDVENTTGNESEGWVGGKELGARTGERVGVGIARTDAR